MKKNLSLLLFAVSNVLMVHAQTNQEPFMTKSLSTESIRNAEVQTSGGSIVVSGVNASEARIEVYVKPNNNGDSDALSKEEIQKRLNEDYNLNISVSNNTVTAVAKSKDRNMNWKKGLSISFKVFVPQNVSTNLATSGGSISLTNLSGSQEFSTSGGSLNVQNLSGKIKGRTSGGSINVADSKDDIDLSTSGGSIEANNCNGSIRLSTSGGSLKLSALKGNIKASTSGGSINGNSINGELIAHTSGGSINLRDLMCSVETSTSGGHINVAIKEFGKYAKISNPGGNIDVQLPYNKGINLNLSARKINTEALDNFNGTGERSRINGKLNGGGIPVDVSAGSGTIRLSFEGKVI
ncbi:MAG: hypothetical protein WKF91_14960 [Segetibacter sp.]